jgi:hypothetical protein
MANQLIKRCLKWQQRSAASTTTCYLFDNYFITLKNMPVNSLLSVFINQNCPAFVFRLVLDKVLNAAGFTNA